jgi:ATP-dependent helicase/DNAse subunit B
MYKKIDVFVNGLYEFSTTHYPTIEALKKHIREVKHIEIASIPKPRYLTVYDYDKLICRYAKD